MAKRYRKRTKLPFVRTAMPRRQISELLQLREWHVIAVTNQHGPSSANAIGSYGRPPSETDVRSRKNPHNPSPLLGRFFDPPCSFPAFRLLAQSSFQAAIMHRGIIGQDGKYATANARPSAQFLVAHEAMALIGDGDVPVPTYLTIHNTVANVQASGDGNLLCLA